MTDIIINILKKYNIYNGRYNYIIKLLKDNPNYYNIIIDKNYIKIFNDNEIYFFIL